MSRTILVFDMDGVLVDVSESYRETIARTVEHFTGRIRFRRHSVSQASRRRLRRRGASMRNRRTSGHGLIT